MTPPAREPTGDSEISQGQTACYRCDRPLDPDRAVRISAEPGPATDVRYVSTTYSCCPSCTAGIGLLEIVRLSPDGD